MWVPAALVELFQISRSTVDTLRNDLSAVKAENEALRYQILITQNNFEWIRSKVNTLELEKAALINKAYGIVLPAPELVRTPMKDLDPNEFSFEDIGEKMAKKFGMPSYDDTTP